MWRTVVGSQMSLNVLDIWTVDFSSLTANVRHIQLKEIKKQIKKIILLTNKTHFMCCPLAIFR